MDQNMTDAQFDALLAQAQAQTKALEAIRKATANISSIVTVFAIISLLSFIISACSALG